MLVSSQKQQTRSTDNSKTNNTPVSKNNNKANGKTNNKVHCRYTRKHLYVAIFKNNFTKSVAA